MKKLSIVFSLITVLFLSGCVSEYFNPQSGKFAHAQVQAMEGKTVDDVRIVYGVPSHASNNKLSYRYTKRDYKGFANVYVDNEGVIIFHIKNGKVVKVEDKLLD